MFIRNIDGDRIGPVKEVDHHPGLVDNEGQSDMTRRISRQQKRQEQQDSWEKQEDEEEETSFSSQTSESADPPQAEADPEPRPGHLDYKA